MWRLVHSHGVIGVLSPTRGQQSVNSVTVTARDRARDRHADAFGIETTTTALTTSAR